MAAETDDVNIRFGASIDDLKSKLGEVQGIFKELTEKFAAMAAIVAGGAAFKSFIDETNNLNAEAMRLSKTLGITGEDAGTLNTALGAAGVSAETYTGSFTKFNRALRQHSDELQAVGVDVAGFNAGQVTSNELFAQGLTAVMAYAPGIDQTQAAMALFGRSVDDVQKLQKLFATVTDATAERLGQTREELNATLTPMQRYQENLETAKEKNEQLNLVITKEGVDASRKYKEAMEEVDLVLHGLEKTVGEAVIPIFTESANKLASIGPALVEGMQYAAETFVAIWHEVSDAFGTIWDAIRETLGAISDGLNAVFGEEGPGAMQIFRNALGIVQAVFISFRVAVQEIVAGVMAGLAELRVDFVTFAEVAERALHLDFAGAKAAFKSGLAERAQLVREHTALATQLAQNGAADLEKALMGAPDIKHGTPKGAPPGGTKHWEVGKSKSGADADNPLLSARVGLEKADQEAILGLQQQYLKEEAAANEDAYKQGLVSLQDYYDRKLAIELQNADLTLEAKRKELQAVQDAEAQARAKEGSATTSAERNKYEAQALKFQADETKLLGQINVLESQRGEIIRKNGVDRAEAERQLRDALSTVGATVQKGRADDDIANERAKIDALRQMNQISAEEEFAMKRQFEAREFAAAQAFLANKRALIREGDFKALVQQDADEEAAERAHQAKLLQIDIAADAERRKYGVEASNSIQGSFANMVGSILSGTTRMGEAIRNFGKSIGTMFTELIAKKFTESLFNATGLNKSIEQMVTFVTEGIGRIVRQWLLGQTEQTAATAAGTTQRTALESSASAASTAATSGTAIANIGAKAWEAAASVYASIAAIPVVGPFLAPAAAIAASAVVLSFVGRIASSAGGDMQVDQDRLNFVHKDETILPARFAQGLRALVGEGGASPLQLGINQLVSSVGPGGAPVAAQSWQLPNVGRASAAPAQAGGLASALSAAASGGGSPTFVLPHGMSPDALYMTTGGALIKYLNKSGRDFRRK